MGQWVFQTEKITIKSHLEISIYPALYEVFGRTISIGLKPSSVIQNHTCNSLLFLSLHLSKAAVSAVEAFNIFAEPVNGFKVFDLSKECKNWYYKGFNSKKTQAFNKDLKRLFI